VVGELALVREAGVRGHLRQGTVGSCVQELPGPFDAAQDDELLRRQSGGMARRLGMRSQRPDLAWSSRRECKILRLPTSASVFPRSRTGVDRSVGSTLGLGLGESVEELGPGCQGRTQRGSVPISRGHSPCCDWLASSMSARCYDSEVEVCDVAAEEPQCRTWLMSTSRT
jgi:hypothetical protein